MIRDAIWGSWTDMNLTRITPFFSEKGCENFIFDYIM